MVLRYHTGDEDSISSGGCQEIPLRSSQEWTPHCHCGEFREFKSRWGSQMSKNDKNFEGLAELIEEFNIPLINSKELRLVEVEGVAYLLDKNDNCRYMMPMEDYLALLEWKQEQAPGD